MLISNIIYVHITKYQKNKIINFDIKSELKTKLLILIKT